MLNNPFMCRMLTIVAIPVFAACGRKGQPTVTPVATTSTTAAEPAGIRPTDRLYYNDGSTLTDSVRTRISTAVEWNDLWQRMNADQTPVPKIPAVDFSTHMLIVAGAGRMSTGDEIRIDSVLVARDKTITIVTRTITACRKFPGNVYPLEVVQIQKSDSRVVFSERREQAGCQ